MAEIAHEVKFGVEVNVDKAVKSLDGLSATLATLDSKVTTGLIKKLDDLGRSLNNLGSLGGVAEFGKTLKGLGTGLDSFASKINSIDVSKFAASFSTLTDTIASFSSNAAKFNKAINALSGVAGVKTVASDIASLGKVLSNVDGAKFSETLSTVGAALAGFSDNAKKYVNSVSNISSTPLNVEGLAALKDAAAQLRAFGVSVSKIDAGKFTEAFNAINTAFTAFAANTDAYTKAVAALSATTGLKEAGADLAAFGKAMEKFSASSGKLDFTEMAKSLSNLSTILSALPNTGTAFAATLTTLATSLTAFSQGLADAPMGKFAQRMVKLAEGVGELSKTIAPLSALAPMAQSIADLGTALVRFGIGVEEAGKGLRGLSKNVDAIDALASKAPAFTALSSIVPQITQLGSALSSLAPQVALIAGAAQQLSDSKIGETLLKISTAFTALGGVNVATIFNDQANGVAALSAVLTSTIGSIVQYANALTSIARASNSIVKSGDTLSYLSAQAAGVQLLSNAVGANITILQNYANVLKSVAMSMTRLASAQASMTTTGGAGGFARGLSAMATAAPTVIPQLQNLSAALKSFAIDARSAASALRSLVTQFNRLPSTLTLIPTLISAIVGPINILGRAMGGLASIASGFLSSFRGLGRLSNIRLPSVSGGGGGGISGGVSRMASPLTEIGQATVGYFSADKAAQLVKSIGNTGAEFSNAMGFVKAVSRNASDYTEANFKAMGEEALRLGRNTTYSATEAANALKELTQGGLTTRQSMEALTDTMKLAEIEEMNVKDAARIVTSTMAQFQASASELSTYIDQLAKTSAVTKTSIDQLKYALAYTGTAARSANQPFYEIAAALGAMSTAGVESSKAGTTLRDFLSDLTDTTSYSYRKLLALGLTAEQINPRFNKLSNIIGVLKNRGVDAADAMAIFGVRGGLAAGSLITIYDEYVQTLNEVQNSSKGTANAMQADVSSNLLKDLKRLETAWDYLKNKIFAGGFEDVARNIVQKVRSYVLTAADAIDGLRSALKFDDAAQGLSLIAEFAGKEFINYFSTAVATIVDLFNAAFVGTIKITGRIFAEILGGVFGQTSGVFGKGLEKAIASLQLALAALIVKTGANLSESLSNPFTKLLVVILDGFDRVADIVNVSVVEPINYAITKIGNLFSKDKTIKLHLENYEKTLSDIKLIEDLISQEKAAGRESNVADLQKKIPQLEKNRALAEFALFGQANLTTEEKKQRRVNTETGLQDTINKNLGINKERAQQDLELAMRSFGQGVVEFGQTDVASYIKNAEEIIARNFGKDFVNAYETAGLKDKLVEMFNLYKPVDKGAPFKSTSSPFSKTQVTEGVGPTNLRGEGTGGPRVASLTEIGGMAVRGFGMELQDPLTRNTEATIANTAAILGKPAGGTTPTLGVVPKRLTESEIQTDLATYARTGKMPERLKANMDAINAEQQRTIDAKNAAAKKEKDAADENAFNAAEQARYAAATKKATQLTNQFGAPFGLEVPTNLLGKFGDTSGVGVTLGNAAAPTKPGISGIGMGSSQLDLLRSGAGITNKFGGTVLPSDVEKSLYQNLLNVKPKSPVTTPAQLLNLTPDQLTSPTLIPSTSSASPFTSVGGAADAIKEGTALISTSYEKYGVQQVDELKMVNDNLSTLTNAVREANKSGRLVIKIS